MAHTVTREQYEAAFDLYVAFHGEKPNYQQQQKLWAILHVNGSMFCRDCGAPLAGGVTTEYDHRHGNGGENRADGKRSRHEIAEILAAIKRHGAENVDVSHAAFLCNACNGFKGKMPLEQWLNSERLAWRRANR